MRKISLITIAILALSSQELFATENVKNTITVIGTGKVEVKPDIAYLTFYVKGDGILMTDAVQKAKQKMNEIKKAISDKHNDIKGISSVDIKIGEKKREYWSSNQKDEFSPPEVVKRLRITIPPTPLLAYEITDTAMRAGAVLQIPSSIYYPGEIKSILVYGLFDSSESKDQVKKKALDDAKKNAGKLAALVGKKVGDVVSVGCRSSLAWPRENCIMGRESDLPVKYFGLDPEKLDVSYKVTVTYELLQK